MISNCEIFSYRFGKIIHLRPFFCNARLFFESATMVGSSPNFTSAKMFPWQLLTKKYLLTLTLLMWSHCSGFTFIGLLQLSEFRTSRLVFPTFRLWNLHKSRNFNYFFPDENTSQKSCKNLSFALKMLMEGNQFSFKK